MKRLLAWPFLASAMITSASVAETSTVKLPGKDVWYLAELNCANTNSCAMLAGVINEFYAANGTDANIKSEFYNQCVNGQYKAYVDVCPAAKAIYTKLYRLSKSQQVKGFCTDIIAKISQEQAELNEARKKAENY